MVGKKHDPRNLTKLKGFSVGNGIIETAKISTDELKNGLLGQEESFGHEN